ncbi:hydrogenase formation protein HypD [bacterium]|nr:hydrogenase formation protein HypD [bacterium]
MNLSEIPQIIAEIKEILDGRKIRLMEVCGTHTVAISRSGFRPMFAPDIELLSGPGCPVCVTPASDIAKSIWLAENGKIVVTFGDMMKVPVNGTSLLQLKAQGAKIEVVYSPLESLDIARENPSEEVVFIGVGFETTIPTIAGTIKVAEQMKLNNFSVLPSAKTIPIPLDIICQSPDIAVDGFILPGHVSVIIGAKPYSFIAEKYRKPGVITGFEPMDIIDGIYLLVDMLKNDAPQIKIAYKRVVSENGNESARKLIDEIFEPCDSDWRGIGILPNSGLAIREEYSDFDAQRKFNIPDFPDAKDNPACKCDSVILGILKPTDCPLFGEQCTPQNPQGPCMISSEGACAAYYKYGE